MDKDLALKAAAQFGQGKAILRGLEDGFTHCDYLNPAEGNQSIILQKVNPRVIPLPENIIGNYLLIEDHLKKQRLRFQLADLVKSHQQKLYWIDEEEDFWLAAAVRDELQHHANAPDSDHAGKAASFYANLTRSLVGVDISSLNVIVPGFHDLPGKFKHFEAAIEQGAVMRLLRATHVISELRQRKSLLGFFSTLNDETKYPTRVVAHNARVSNLLFDNKTNSPKSLLNHQTVMAGKFFSDPGELIRTCVSPVNEDSTAWEQIGVRPDFYEAVINGYRNGAANGLTPAEDEQIHYSGLIMTCIQCLRFVTDFLENDIYFHTSYPEQNLNRALNQLILLEALEDYLLEKHGFTWQG